MRFRVVSAAALLAAVPGISTAFGLGDETVRSFLNAPLNAEIELFATAAVLARTQSFIDELGVARCAHELALCDLFCVEAGRRFRAARNALDSREDEVDARRRAIATDVGKGEGYLVRDAILEG